MDTIAENRTVVTKKSFCEAMTAIDGYRKTAMKGLAVMAAAWAALAVFTLWSGYPIGMAVIELLVLGAVGAWLLLLLPRSRYRRAFRAMEQRYGGNLERIIRFYGEFLEVETCQGIREFDYADIETVRTTPRLVALRMYDSTGLFFDAHGFTKGTAEQVKSLMNKDK